MSTRWQKLRRDAAQYRGRLAMMVVAIAVSVLGVTAVLTAFSILRREIQANYRGTRPASATVLTHGVPAAVLAQIRQRPDVAAAEIRQTVEVRAHTASGAWQAMLLFVVADFAHSQISTVEHLAGPVTPPLGTVLLERTARPLFGAGADRGTVLLQLPDGRRRALAVRGTVHDRSLPPAAMEKTGYGFITPQTLAALGLPAPDDELRLLVAPDPYADVTRLRAVAEDVARQLTRAGVAVDQVQVPLPGTHSHQPIMQGIMSLLLAFALLAMLLSAVLVATLLGGLLAGQTRQIGVMKTLGATTRQLATLYLVLVGALSLAALALGVAPGLWLGRALADRVAETLNFTIASYAVPAAVLAAVAAVGLLVPLALAWGPVRRATRLSVRAALADFGVAPTVRRGRLERALGRLPGLSRPLLVTLQNAVRQRRRLVLTLGLLSAGGAMFLTALTLLNSWTRTVDDAFARRRYDQEVWLTRPVAADSLLALARHQPGVTTAEAWNLRPAAFGEPDQSFAMTSTYADQRHGSLYAVVAPAGSRLLDVTPAEGRWLTAADTAAVVLNPAALAQAPAGTKVGSAVWLASEGGPLRRYQVVGLIREVATPASLYLTPGGLRRLGVAPDGANVLRLATTPALSAASLETALQRAGFGLQRRWSTVDFRAAVSDHIYIFVGALLFMAGLMAVVGLLGLAATMSTSVVERTREFGVMRTLGGTPGTVRRLVLLEGLTIAVASCFVALALAVPLAALLCRMIGNMAFRTPLTLTLSLGPWGLWLALVTLFAAVATLAPAWQATRRTVRAALAYE